MQRLVVFFFLILSSWTSTTAQTVAPKYSNEFLNLGVGARSFGMGLSAVSNSNDVTSGYWNPAGLMNVEKKHQMMLMHAAYYAGIANYDYGAFVTTIDSVSKIGFSVMRFAVDNIPDTRFLFDANGAINYDQIRLFTAADYAFFMSYARKLNWLGGINMGGNLKVIHRIAGEFATSWGFGLDVGFQKNLNKWQFGLMGKDIFGTFNAWSHNPDALRDVYTATGNELPSSSIEVTLPRLIFGASRRFDLSEKFSVMLTSDMEMTFDGKRNTVLKSNFASVDPRAGMEVGFLNIAFLRLGVAQFQQVRTIEGDRNWTFLPSGGVGVKLSDLTIDYALTDIGDQAAGLYSHVFSVKVDFNAKDK